MRLRLPSSSDFLGPPTPTSYGEVPSLSRSVAQNMPNAASNIVRPSFNYSFLNYHLSGATERVKHPTVEIVALGIA